MTVDNLDPAPPSPDDEIARLRRELDAAIESGAAKDREIEELRDRLDELEREPEPAPPVARARRRVGFFEEEEDGE